MPALNSACCTGLDTTSMQHECVIQFFAAGPHAQPESDRTALPGTAEEIRDLLARLDAP
jgi:hypothetical protein